MNLFEIQTQSGRSGLHRRSKWLIVADSLFEALWRVPDEVTIEAVDVRSIPARTRGRRGRSATTWKPGGGSKLSATSMRSRARRDTRKPNVDMPRTEQDWGNPGSSRLCGSS
jgi:hypothetical protein